MPDAQPRNIQQGRPDDGYKPLQLIGVIVLALLGFAVFFLSFLLAPLAILVLFYIGFSAADRNQRAKSKGHAPPPEPVPEDPAAVPFSEIAEAPLRGPATAPPRPTGIPVPAAAPGARTDLLTPHPTSPR